jgi:hypothetical protein
LWVAFHENASDRFEMAKNQPTPVVAPAAPPPPSPSSTATRDSEALQSQSQGERATHPPAGVLSKPSDMVAADKPTGVDDFKPVLKQKAPIVPTEQAKIEGEVNRLDKKSLPMNGRNVSSLNELSAGRYDAKKDAGEFSRQQPGASAAAPVQAAPPQFSAGAAGGVVSPPALAKPTQAEPPAAAKEPAPPGAVSQTVEVTSQNQQNQTVVVGPLAQEITALPRSSATMDVLRLARSKSPTTITTPDQKVLWRIEAAGIVQRSTDAGSTWTLQKSGVVADLTAGSAPSDKVCWIVGLAGTILRTTDGGAHWRKVRSPIADDLSTVFAVDAQQATISATSNPKTSKTYKTIDAGHTWTSVPNP